MQQAMTRSPYPFCRRNRVAVYFPFVESREALQALPTSFGPASSLRHFLEHFQAKHALGLDPRVDTGSPSENATT
jgi:hypothetical protein